MVGPPGRSRRRPCAERARPLGEANLRPFSPVVVMTPARSPEKHGLSLSEKLLPDLRSRGCQGWPAPRAGRRPPLRAPFLGALPDGVLGGVLPIPVRSAVFPHGGAVSGASDLPRSPRHSKSITGEGLSPLRRSAAARRTPCRDPLRSASRPVSASPSPRASRPADLDRTRRARDRLGAGDTTADLGQPHARLTASARRDSGRRPRPATGDGRGPRRRTGPVRQADRRRGRPASERGPRTSARGPRLVEVARRRDISRRRVHKDAKVLGAVRPGGGPRPRLRLDPAGFAEPPGPPSRSGHHRAPDWRRSAADTGTRRSDSLSRPSRASFDPVTDHEEMSRRLLGLGLRDRSDRQPADVDHDG